MTKAENEDLAERQGRDTHPAGETEWVPRGKKQFFSILIQGHAMHLERASRKKEVREKI